MNPLLRLLRDATIRPVETAISRAAVDVVLLMTMGLLVLVAAGYGADTLHTWLKLRQGPIAASAIMAGIFLILAIMVAIGRMSIAGQRKAEDRTRQTARQAVGVASVVGEQLLRAVGAAASGEPVAFTAARKWAGRANPWMLVAIAIAAGFAGGKILDRDEERTNRE